MAQHDYVIANQSGAGFRADLNNALSAIVSQNSGALEPSTTYAYMTWADTTTGLYKIRNAANSDWITLYQLDGEWSTIALENGTAAAPSLYFKDSGTDTGVYSPGTDQVGVATAGVQRVNFNGSTEVVFNDTGADVDFRIEGDNEPNLFVIDAGTDQVRVANLNGGPLAGFRNLLINGQMYVNQRGAGPFPAGFQYTSDRWKASAAERVTIGSGPLNSNALTVTGAAVDIAQGVELTPATGAPGPFVSGSVWTISLWATTAPTTSASFVDSPLVATNAVNVLSLTAMTATSETNSGFTKYKATFTVAASPNPTNTALQIAFNGVTGSISRAQLEPGTVATPFEYRPSGTEEALCQRYFIKSSQTITALSPFTPGSTSSNLVNNVQFPVTMRSTPTVTLGTQVPGGGAAVNIAPEGFTYGAIIGAVNTSYFVSGFSSSAEL